MGGDHPWPDFSITWPDRRGEVWVEKRPWNEPEPFRILSDEQAGTGYPPLWKCEELSDGGTRYMGESVLVKSFKRDHAADQMGLGV